MFNNNKSDFGATIGGFLIVGFLALLLGITMWDLKFDFTGETYFTYLGSLFSIVCIIGIITGFICLYKAFLTEGVTFILVSVCALSISGGIYGFPFVVGMPVAIAFLVAFVIAGFMGFREGYLDLAIINGLFGAFALGIFGFTYEPEAMVYLFLGIFTVAAAAVSFYVALVEWMGAQDFIQEYEEAVFGCGCDDECGCGCEDDDECECGENCTCNKDE